MDGPLPSLAELAIHFCMWGERPPLHWEGRQKNFNHHPGNCYQFDLYPVWSHKGKNILSEVWKVPFLNSKLSELKLNIEFFFALDPLVLRLRGSFYVIGPSIYA